MQTLGVLGRDYLRLECDTPTRTLFLSVGGSVQLLLWPTTKVVLILHVQLLLLHNPGSASTLREGIGGRGGSSNTYKSTHCLAGSLTYTSQRCVGALQLPTADLPLQLSRQLTAGGGEAEVVMMRRGGGIDLPEVSLTTKEGRSGLGSFHIRHSLRRIFHGGGEGVQGEARGAELLVGHQHAVGGACGFLHGTAFHRILQGLKNDMDITLKGDSRDSTQSTARTFRVQIERPSIGPALQFVNWGSRLSLQYGLCPASGCP